MMKKIKLAALLISILVFCTMSVVFAEEAYAPSFVVIDDYTISMTGNVSKDLVGKNATIAVFMPSGSSKSLSDITYSNNADMLLSNAFLHSVDQCKIAADGDTGRYSFTIKMDTETATEGIYSVKLAISGMDFDESDMTYTFNYYSTDTKNDLLDDVNEFGATSETVDSLAPVFNMVVTDTDYKNRKSTIIEVINAEKNAADSKEFADFNAISKAWNTASLIYDIRNGKATEISCFETLEQLGVDTSQYTGLFENALNSLKENDVKTLDDIVEVMEEHKLLNTLTSSNRETLTQAFADNESAVFNTTQLKSAYETYKDFDAEDNAKANALILAASNPSLDKLRENFISAVNSVNKGNTGGTGGGSGGGSSGGGGNIGLGGFGGGGSVTGQTHMTSPIDSPDAIEEMPAAFNDLEGYDWAKDSIEILAELDIVSGNGDGGFNPGGLVTRAEFVKILVNVFEVYNPMAECNAPDVAADAWYYTYIASAIERGVLKGDENGNINPDDNITRQDMAVMIYRMTEAMELELKSGDAEFTDGEMISDYAAEAVNALASNGIITGMPDGSFAPLANSTRAEAAVMLYRIWKLV